MSFRTTTGSEESPKLPYYRFEGTLVLFRFASPGMTGETKRFSSPIKKAPPVERGFDNYES
jgi:hypothetical protein